MQRIRLFGLAVTVLAALALAQGGALAMGSSSGSSSSSSSASSSSSSDSSDWGKARKAIAAKDYEAAVPLLKAAVRQDPKNADAFNYLGYTSAREGRNDEALGYYNQALALEPKHKGANEYLGELYLKLGNLAAAEQRLDVLDHACFFGCPEFDALKAAVADYKRTGKFTSHKSL